jgi:hypothetical protein
MKQWLRELFDQYLANVSELTPHDRSKAEAWANWIKAKWAEQGFHSPAEQKSLMAEVRQSLENRLGHQHIALATLTLDNAPVNDSQSKEAIATVSSNNGKSSAHHSTPPSTTEERQGDASPGMLTAREAYLVACDRGYSSSKQQMQKLARQSPAEFQEKYGLAYSKSVSFGRNARNWIDRWVSNRAPSAAPSLAPTPAKPSSPSDSDLHDTMQQIGQTLLWFIQQIEDLRSQCAALENGRGSRQDSAQYTDLQQENRDLRAEQDTLYETLDRIHTTFSTSTQAAKTQPSPSKATPKSSKVKRSTASSKAPKAANTDQKRTKTSSAATETTAKPATRGRPSKKANLDPIAVRVMNAIMDYNNVPGRSHDEKWVISYPTMKDLLRQVGSSTQPKIREVFDAYKADIKRHHRKHKLTSRHNRVHGQQSISEVIQLES